MFFLSTQICWDVTAGADLGSSNLVSSSVDWFTGLDDKKDVGISTITYGQVLTGVELLETHSDRSMMKRNLAALIAEISPPFSIDVNTAKTWSELEPLYLATRERKFRVGMDVPMTSERRLVVACALRHSATLVENEQPYHDVLKTKFGLKTLDPNTSEASS